MPLIGLFSHIKVLYDLLYTALIAAVYLLCLYLNCCGEPTGAWQRAPEDSVTRLFWRQTWMAKWRDLDGKEQRKGLAVLLTGLAGVGLRLCDDLLSQVSE